MNGHDKNKTELINSRRKKACYAGVRREALQALARFCNIASVITLPNSWVAEYCHSNNIPVTFIAKGQKKEAFSFLAKQTCQLVLSAGFPFIIPEQILASGPIFINSHPALLPAYVGYSPIKQAFENKEPYMGVTVHYMIPEVDAGKHIHQEKVSVKGMTLQEIYDLLFGVVEPMAITKAIELLFKEGILGK